MCFVKEIEEKDIKYIVEIHGCAFQNFFLTQLGDNFLKLYYTSVLRQRNGVLLGYYEENELLGFCAASTLSRGFNKHLLIDNLVSYSLMGLKLLLTAPSKILRLINNLNKSNTKIKDDGNYAELFSIGIKPEAQNRGIGKQLLLELERLLAKKKIKQLSLTTDFYNNENSLNFYKSMGYEIMYDFIAYPNRKMYRLIKQI